MNAADIEAEHQRRLRAHPHARWGWSFMYAPEASLAHARMVLVGLNPGGRQVAPAPEWDYTSGANAYLDEAWGGSPPGESPLQQQVRALVSAIDLRPDQVFAANLVPFRSPSWADLPDKSGALRFSRTLWRDLLSRTDARLFASLGKPAAREVAALLDAAYVSSAPAGWGRHTIDRYASADGRTVLALPHLSRFRIFSETRTLAAAHVRSVAREVLGPAG